MWLMRMFYTWSRCVWKWTVGAPEELIVKPVNNSTFCTRKKRPKTCFFNQQEVKLKQDPEHLDYSATRPHYSWWLYTFQGIRKRWQLFSSDIFLDNPPIPSNFILCKEQEGTRNEMLILFFCYFLLSYLECLLGAVYRKTRHIKINIEKSPQTLRHQSTYMQTKIAIYK